MINKIIFLLTRQFQLKPFPYGITLRIWENPTWILFQSLFVLLRFSFFPPQVEVMEVLSQNQEFLRIFLIPEGGGGERE